MTALTKTATPARWWPSRYGADDEAGALNEITSGATVRAANLVRRGLVLDLSHVLDEHVPAFPGRAFRQYLTTSAHQVNRRAPEAGTEGLGRNNVNWVVEYVSAPSQMGTHMDGLNHLQIGDRAYNGHRLADVVEEYGTNRLGIDTLPQVVTRGVLLDIAEVRGVERLERGDVITRADAEIALDRGGVALPATRSCSTPDGVGTGGVTTRRTSPASRARARPSPNGWWTIVSR